MNIHRVFIDGVFSRFEWFLEVQTLMTPDQIPDLHVRAIYKVLLNEYYHDADARPDRKTFPDLVARKYSEKVARTLTEYVFAVEVTLPDRSEFKHAVRMMLVEGKKERIQGNISRALGALEKNQLEGIDAILTAGLDSFDVTGSVEVDARRGVDDFLLNYREPLAPGIPTGIPELDRLTGGGRPGQLWIWGAYTGEGKTKSMIEIAYYMVTHGHNVAWITLEMEAREMEELFIVRNAHKIKTGGVDAKRVETRTLEPEERDVFEAAAIDWRDNADYGSIYVWRPNRFATLRTIETRLQTLRQLIDADVLVLDYLEIIHATRLRKEYRLEVKEKMQLMKRIAADLGLFAITGHQISRKGREDAGKRGYFQLSDLGESAGVEQNASLVAWSLRTEKLLEARQLRFGVMKNRHGKTLHKGVDVEEQFDRGRIKFDIEDE